VPPPDIPRREDRPRLPDGLEARKRIDQDRPLLPHVKGLPQGMAERIAKEERPRGLDLHRDLFLKGDSDRGNLSLLNDALDQAHGLIAEPSRGRQHNGLGPFP